MEKVETHHWIEKVPSFQRKRSYKPMAKKGQLGTLLFANPIVLIILGIILLFVIASVFGIAWFVSINIFTFLGAALTIISAMMISRGMVTQTTWGLMLVGLGLLATPLISPSLSNIKLAAILP